MKGKTPLILAVMSGKGGVGKTLLSSALAEALSHRGRVLVVDLDFFNRGMSGLFNTGERLLTVPPPGFVRTMDESVGEPWHVIEVEKNIIHVSYPDLLPVQLAELEAFSPEELKDEIDSFLHIITSALNISAVVLDCHGGPDRTSFAAAWLAHHAILVSEPDRITFHGTLNFLRQMEHDAPEAKPDVNLVFNKVGPNFSYRFLKRIYRQSLREELGDKDLLAVFPLETHISNGFEKTPLITATHPYSQLALKTQILLFDLLGSEFAYLIPPDLAKVPRWLVWKRRASLGRLPWVFDPNVIAIMFIGLAALFGLIAMAEEWDLHIGDFVDDYLGDWEFEEVLFVGTAISMVWFFICILLSCSRWIERYIVRKCRGRSRFMAAIWFCLLLLIWAPVLIFGVTMLSEADAILYYFLVCVILLSPQGFRIYISSSIPNTWFEHLLRSLFIIFFCHFIFYHL